MTQLDPHRHPQSSAAPQDTGGSPPTREAPFWRVTVGMAAGLVLLFGVLFGLRGLHIFPPEPDQDAGIVAVRATQSAIQTEPTQVVTSAGAPPVAATEVPTPAALRTIAPAPAQGQASAGAETAVGTGTVLQTSTGPSAATPEAQSGMQATTAPIVAPTVSAAPTTAPGRASSTDAPTPVAVNLPADLANAILQGYSNYWTVRLNAQRDPWDTSIDLASVMDGNELIGAQKSLAQYRDAGEAFDTSITHTIWITSASSDDAVLIDRFTATARRVDPNTNAALEATSSTESRIDTFEMRPVDGTWKVVDEP